MATRPSAATTVTHGPAYLFCPADRPDRFERAAAAADVVVIDLEDAVARDDRPRARSNLSRARLDPDTTIVRVNAVGTEDHRLDLEALEGTPFRRVMLAKTESKAHLSALIGWRVTALVETALGVSSLSQILSAKNLEGVMWGAEDLIVSLGGWASRDESGTYLEPLRMARSLVVMHAAAHGLPAIDAVHLDISDAEGVRREAGDAAAQGYAAKACIHPAQVPHVRSAFRPSPSRVEWAERVLAHASQSVATVAGQLVDEPVVQQARRILALDAFP